MAVGGIVGQRGIDWLDRGTCSTSDDSVPFLDCLSGASICAAELTGAPFAHSAAEVLEKAAEVSAASCLLGDGDVGDVLVSERFVDAADLVSSCAKR